MNKKICLATVVGVVIALVAVRCFTVTYSDSSTDVNTGLTVSMNYRWWNGLPLGASISGVDKSTGVHVDASGKVASNGQRHGLWRELILDETQDVYYWFGEEITEAQWNQRQGR